MFNALITNYFLIIPLCAWTIAQISKMFVELFQGKGLDFRYLVGSGGMPSSHSAIVTSLATTVGMIQGFGTAEFAISVVFALIVLYDSAGVRQAASRQAMVLNHIIREMRSKQPLTVLKDDLRELIGHTPTQVVVGATIGIVFSLLWIKIAGL